jgi:hypothetical protein
LYSFAISGCLQVESLDLEKIATTFPAVIRGERELQDHKFASFTHIIASFRRFAAMGGEITDGCLPSPEIGGVMSRFGIRAKICARKISLDSSIQAQEMWIVRKFCAIGT